MQNILVVEDDHDLNQAICYSLKKSGYGTYGAESAESGRTEFLRNRIDLVLLDVNLPDGEGFSFCRWIKSRKETPVIYLTARDMEEDVLTGYESGAEDYITKPFSLSVLRARVNTQLRKAVAMGEKEKDNEHVYRKEPYVFDFDRMKFMVDGKEIELSKTEQKLLRILVENAGMNMRRELLLDRVWSDGAEYVDENALSVSIKRLRDKLGAEQAVRTVYGIGYRWE